MGSIALIHSQIWPLDPVCSSSGPPRPGSCHIILLIPWGHPSTSLPPLGRFGNTILHPCQACAHALARRIHVARRHNHGACKLRSSATTLLPTAKHFMAAGKRSSTNGVGIDSLITSSHKHNYYFTFIAKYVSRGKLVHSNNSVATCILQLMARKCIQKSFYHKHMSCRYLTYDIGNLSYVTGRFANLAEW